jgi:type III secretion protein T
MGIAGIFSSELAWHWLIAYGLALARPLALLGINPMFARLQIGSFIRGAVATGLALPMVPRVAVQLHEASSTVAMLLLCAKEAVVGTVMGLLLGVPFWALDVAGDVLDAQRGATQGRLNDPAGFENVSISGTLLLMSGIALFVLTGGLETLTQLLYGSWSLWPPLGALPRVDAQTPRLLLGLLDRLTGQGMLLAGPIVVAMLLTDMAMMIVARVAPQLRTDDMVLSARNIVFVLALPLYAAFLVTYARQGFAVVPSTLNLMRTMAVPGAAP